jgi:hypothetical protein
LKHGSIGTIARALVVLVGAGAAASCAAIAGIGHPDLIGSGGGGSGGTGPTASSASVGTGGPNGGGGSGGDGGNAPRCTPTGKVIPALTQAELGGHGFSSVPVLIADDASSVRQVHLAVLEEGTNQLIVRSIRGDPPHVTDSVTSIGLNGPQPIGGQVVGNLLRVFVLAGDTLGEVQFSLVGGELQQSPSFVSWDTPQPCVDHAFGSVAVFWDGTRARYLVGCKDPPDRASLWIGDSAQMPTEIAMDFDEADPMLFPQVYGVIGNTSFAFFRGPGDVSDVFSFGNGVGLAATKPFSYDGGTTTLFAALLAGGSLTVIGSGVDSASNDTKVFNETRPVIDLGKLQQPLSKTGNTVGSFSGSKAFGGAFGLPDGDGFVGADKAGDQRSVVFSWFGARGTPLVLEQKIYETAMGATHVANARAAPLDDTTKAVVWIEATGSDVEAKAQLLTCTKASN